MEFEPKQQVKVSQLSVGVKVAISVMVLGAAVGGIALALLLAKST
ncbi:MAG: hypothetical protein WC289_01260 [Patescibacteria group bacterium]|jgi:hypothetical protein